MTLPYNRYTNRAINRNLSYNTDFLQAYFCATFHLVFRQHLDIFDISGDLGIFDI